MNNELIVHLNSLSHCLIHKNSKEWDKLFEYLDQRITGKSGSNSVYYAACCNTMLYYRGKNGYHKHKLEPIRISELNSQGKLERAGIFLMLKEANMKKGDHYIYPAFNYPHLDFGLQNRYNHIERKEKYEETKVVEEREIDKGVKKLHVETSDELKKHAELRKMEEFKRITIRLEKLLKKGDGNTMPSLLQPSIGSQLDRVGS